MSWILIFPEKQNEKTFNKKKQKNNSNHISTDVLKPTCPLYKCFFIDSIYTVHLNVLRLHFDMCYSISYFQRYIFTLCVVHSYLFGGGRGRRRTCEQQCRRRKSRRTSPAHPAEAEWGSAPGCSSPDPTQGNECQPLLTFLMWALLKTIIFLLLEKLGYNVN